MNLSSHSSNRPPFPFLTFLVFPDIILALVIALGVSKVTRILFFSAFALLCYTSLQYTTGDKLQDYSMGSTIGGQLFTALHLLLLVEPIKQYRHIGDSDDPRTRPLMKRIVWAGCVIHSPRGIGWNYQTLYLPPRPKMTRGAFIVSRILRAIACFLIIDAAQTFIHTNSLFFEISASTAPLQAPSISIMSQGILYRCLNIVAWMSTPLAGVRMQYYMFAAISVALGLSTPGDWPDPYGNWSDAFTVRNLWGRTWHQMMRRYLSSIGKAITRMAGFEKGTLLSSYTQLIIGFAVSGVMHSFGDAMVGWKYLGASFPFFVIQPVAIILEDTVISLVKRLRYQPSTRISYTIGYIWVFAWSMISFPLYIDWAVRAGLGNCELLPISPIRTILGLA